MLRPGCAILLSGYFLFFVYAFHAAISIRYWFAIDIAIRYRYRSYPAFSIASSDIDSDPERTTTPVAARLRYALCGDNASVSSRPGIFSQPLTFAFTSVGIFFDRNRLTSGDR
uniref:Uncharacterized protein n=2 Tax=Candidatus Kentrum sp. FM TaxID=2126340 RepID=A0A450TSK1_9GAMM|nr:MAG: hypothetical protein BECKFM1743A_GA0114220_105903 [Candidatus Kentron sp. FM]VFK18592.1 MAG: hypothetical protein BECKFM1743B_GA0114221_105593 [Candidatus Kentron sp. FM]